MGLLMLAGLVGTVLYSGYVIKNDIQAEVTDYKTKPTFNKETNQDIIKNNFKDICKRSGIKMDAMSNPINDKKIESAKEYLRYQGYTDSDIDFFTNLFNEKVNDGYTHKVNILKCKNERLKYKLQQYPSTEMVVFRKTIYKSSLSPDERANKLLNNEIWSAIVDHYTYIRANGGGKWEEVWTLKVPQLFFTDITKEELYKNICELEDIEYKI